MATVEAGDAVLRSTTTCPARRSPSSVVDHCLDGGRVGQREEHDVGLARDLGQRPGRARAGAGRARGVEVEAHHVLAAVHQPARDAPAHVPQADDADGHAPSSSMRIGTPTAHEWIPMTLTSSMTSMISSRVAPSPSALRMCARRPGS